MAEEIIEGFKGRISKNAVILEDRDVENELERRGFGEREGKRLSLQYYEVLYLMYTGKLEVVNRGKKVSVNDMVKRYLKNNSQVWTKFLIYRDLRSRGYVAKEGFGFGVDFRVYDRGTFGSKPAKYVIFGIKEGTETITGNLDDMVRKIGRMGKETIIAVIERRGEVIYYKLSEMRFRDRE